MQTTIISRPVCCPLHTPPEGTLDFFRYQSGLTGTLHRLWALSPDGTDEHPFSLSFPSRSLFQIRCGEHPIVTSPVYSSIFSIYSALERFISQPNVIAERQNDCLVAETRLFARDGQLHDQIAIGVNWPAGEWESVLIPLLNTEAITLSRHPFLIDWTSSLWWRIQPTADAVVRETCDICGDEQIHPIPMISWKLVHPQHLINWESLPTDFPALLRMSTRQFHGLRYLAHFPFQVSHDLPNPKDKEHTDVYWFNPDRWTDKTRAASVIAGLIRGSFTWRRLKNFRGFALNMESTDSGSEPDSALTQWVEEQVRKVQQTDRISHPADLLRKWLLR